jgi:hypothetical protein
MKENHFILTLTLTLIDIGIPLISYETQNRFFDRSVPREFYTHNFRYVFQNTPAVLSQPLFFTKKKHRNNTAGLVSVSDERKQT